MYYLLLLSKEMNHNFHLLSYFARFHVLSTHTCSAMTEMFFFFGFISKNIIIIFEKFIYIVIMYSIQEKIS